MMDMKAWTEGRRTDRGWLTQLGTSTSKCTYGDDVDGVHQVKTPVDQVKREHEDLMINGQEQVVTHVDIMEEA